MLKQLSATRGLPASLIAVGVLALSACSSSNDSRVVGPTPPPPTPTASVTPSPTVTTSPSPSPTVTTSPSPSPVADLRDAAGRPVTPTDPDLLTAPPHRVAVDGGPWQEVTGWAGPWPVRSRWWVPGAVGGARLQVSLDDGTAVLLLSRGGRWCVVGVYD